MSDTRQQQDKLAVEATGLTKIYTDFWQRPRVKALNGLDLNIRQGAVFGLLGPNGSGKSTTVKLLLGLLYPSRGSLKVLGASPRDVAIKRRIGYLPEESNLYQYLTGREMLDFLGSLFKIPAAERRNRTAQLLTMVGLEHAGDRYVGEYSKGMARRIGIAQALINDPDLVILDEPTVGLDPIGCREVKDIIVKLKSRGKTVILSSHLLADVEDVCDEVSILYGGRVRAQGSLREILKVKGKTRLVMPELSPALLERVVTVLREQYGDSDIEVDHPAMNLDEFFLEVVNQARSAQEDTSGVQAGGAIPGYLSGEAAAEEAERQKLLKALAGDSEPAAKPETGEPDKAAPAAAPQVDAGRLVALADLPPAAETTAGAPAAAEPADKAAANEKLLQLLNDPKKKG